MTDETFKFYDSDTGEIFDAVEGVRIPSIPRENRAAVEHRIRRMQERGVLIQPYARVESVEQPIEQPVQP